MKLLLIQPRGDQLGHFGIYTTRLAHELGKLGHDVTVCTNRMHVARFIDDAPKFRLIEVGDGNLEVESFEKQANSRPSLFFYGYFRNSWKIVRAGLDLCRQKRFDGIYITDAEFMLATFALKLHRAPLPPVIMQVNASNFSFEEYAGGYAKKFYKVIQREIFRTAIGKEVSAFSILGDWHRDRLRTQLRIDGHFPIELIPDAGGRFPNPIEKNEARARLGISYKGDVFLFLGVLRRDKGLESLARAIELLEAQGRDFRVILAGFPLEYRPEMIQALFRLTERANRIVISKLDYVDEADMPSYFYAADALLLPYNNDYKGSSGPLMKGACTFGLPVIVSDVSEMGSLTRKYRLGITALPGDPNDLARAMAAFLDTKGEERKAMTDRAFALGSANSWVALAERYERAFETLSQERPAPLQVAS